MYSYRAWDVHDAMDIRWAFGLPWGDGPGKAFCYLRPLIALVGPESLTVETVAPSLIIFFSKSYFPLIVVWRFGTEWSGDKVTLIFPVVTYGMVCRMHFRFGDKRDMESEVDIGLNIHQTDNKCVRDKEIQWLSGEVLRQITFLGKKNWNICFKTVLITPTEKCSGLPQNSIDIYNDSVTELAKPWIYGSICTKLKARTTVFNHDKVTGNVGVYRPAMTPIRQAKRQNSTGPKWSCNSSTQIQKVCDRLHTITD